MWLNGSAVILAVCTVSRNSSNLVPKTAKILILLFPILFLQMLAIHCEKYQSDHQPLCQQKLSELAQDLERWLRMSHQLFDRHPTPDFEAADGQRALQELDQVLSELVKQLDSEVNGESGKSRHRALTVTWILEFHYSKFLKSRWTKGSSETKSSSFRIL